MEELKDGGAAASKALAQLIHDQLYSRTKGIQWSLLAARKLKPTTELLEAIKLVASTSPIRQGRAGLFDPEIVGSNSVGWTDGTHERIKNLASKAIAALKATIPSGIDAKIGTKEVIELAAKLAGGWPNELKRDVFSKIDIDKLLKRLKNYQEMPHPGYPGKAYPKYKIVDGRIGRIGEPSEDFKISTTAFCLKGSGKVGFFDERAVKFAFSVIQRYGDKRLAKFLFHLPKVAKMINKGEKLIVAEDFLIDIYKGMENVLFEIYEELGEGKVFTDSTVKKKLLSIINSAKK